MATPDDIQKQLASRQPKVTPVGDVPAATVRAATPPATDVPSVTPTAQATGGSAQARLTRPVDFIGDSAGGVQANTPSAGWSTSPGASNGNQSTWSTEPGANSAPISRSAAQITEAPAWQTSPGAGAPAGTIDAPAAPTRAVQYTPKPAAATPAAADPNDITAEFQKRMRYEAERRANLAAETAGKATPGAAAPAAEAAPSAAGATTGAADAAGTASAAEAAAPGLVRRVAGAAGRLAGTVGAPILIAHGVNEAGAAVNNMRDEGVNATNVGDLTAGIGNTAVGGSLAKSAVQRLLTRAGAEKAAEAVGTKVLGRAVPVVGAAAAGWDIGRAIAPSVNRLSDAASGVSDTIGGTINQAVHGAGKLIGQDWGADEAHQDSFAKWNSDVGRNIMQGRKPWDNGPQASSASPAAGGAAATPQVNFITPDNPTGIRPPAPAGAEARVAMNSTTPGTAVINGRVLSQQEIADAGKRLNIVPSSAFTNPDVGDLYSQTHGGATPTSDQAIALRNSLNGSASAQRMFGTDAGGNPVGVSGGIGAPQDPRQSTIHGLMGQISDALRSGRRRTAKILVDQLSAFDRASQGDMDNSLRRDALNKPQQPGAQTPAQQALDVARAGAAQTQEQVEQMSLAQAKQAQQIQAALQVETDPGKRKVLQQNLAAITGKGGSSGQQLKMANFTKRSGLDTRTIPVPIDMTTGRPVISPEYIQLIQSLQGGQPQAPQKG